MIRKFRSVTKVVMVVVAVAFFGWIVFDVGMGLTGQGVAPTRQAVARVNGTNIDFMTYQTALQAASEQRSRAGASPSTLEDQKEMGDAVMEDLIREIILNQELKRRNITVSDEEIRAAARNSPPPEVEQAAEFQTEGKFDIDEYHRYLSTNPEGFLLALESRYRMAIPQNKLVEELSSTVYVPTTKLWRMYQDQHDSVTATLAMIQPDAVPDETVRTTDQELREYYNAHRDEFKQPAIAFTSYVMLDRQPDAADSAAARDSVNSVRRQIAAGTDFAEMARRVSDDTSSASRGGDLGEVREQSMLPVFERAALALRPGQVSQPVLSPFGWHIIKLDARDAAKKTYHPRHILIAVGLHGVHRDNVESRADSLDRLAAEQDAHQVLDSVGRLMSLPVQQAPPVAEGTRLQLGRMIVPDVGVWAFTARPGETSQVIEGDQAYFVFRLDSLHEEGIPSFERVAGDVRAAVTRARKVAAARATADTLASELKRGTRLQAAAQKLKIPVQTLGPFTRGNPPVQVAEALPAIGAAFGLAAGQVGGPYETESGFYFVETVRKRGADSTKFAAELPTMKAQVMQAAQRERVQQVITSLRDDAQVTDRRKEMERAQRDAEDALPIPAIQ